MSVRSFWIIVVKIFGLVIILRLITEGFQGLMGIYQLAQYTFFSYRSNFQGSYVSQGFDFGTAATVSIYYAIILGFYIYVTRLCLFKPNWVIDKLGLVKDQQEDKLQLNIHRSVVLKIAVIVAGAFFIIDGLPPLFTQLLTYFQHAELYSKFTSSNEAKYIVTDLVKVFLGYFMLTSSRLIVNYFELKRKN